MLRKRILVTALLALLVAIASAVASAAAAQPSAQTVPDLPPPISTALAALNRYLVPPITAAQLQSYSVTQGVYGDTALGCALIPGTPLAAPVQAYQVQLVYQNILYEFEISADNTLIVPCSPPLLAPTVVLPAATPTIGTVVCPPDLAGYLPPRLSVGGYARIGTKGVPNRMRTAPSIEGEQLGLIRPGTTVRVLDGPFCEVTGDGAHIIWWQVQDGTLTGFTAEGVPPDYFLEPVEYGGLPALPAVRDAITTVNASTLVPLAIIPFDGGASVDFGGAGQLLVAGTDGVIIYDLNQLVVSSLPLPADVAVLRIEYSPDGRYIAYSTEANQLYVYNTVTDTTTQLDTEDGVIINDLDFSPDNLLAVAIGDPLGAQDAVNGWGIYNLTDNSQSAFYPTESWVGDVAFGPGGLRLAWLSDTVNMILLQGDLPIVSGQIGQPTRSGLAWQPVADPTDPAAVFRLAYADGNIVQLFDLEASHLMSYINEETYLPGTITFNADGALMAVLNRPVSDEPTPRTLKLFDVVSGDVVYREDLDSARSMAFSPDGTMIVVLTQEDLRFYGVTPTLEAVG